MANISLAFEPNSLLLYGWEVAEVTKLGSHFTRNRTKLYYDIDMETYTINHEGHTLYSGKINSHTFFKQLLKNIEVN